MCMCIRRLESTYSPSTLLCTHTCVCLCVCVYALCRIEGSPSTGIPLGTRFLSFTHIKVDSRAYFATLRDDEPLMQASWKARAQTRKNKHTNILFATVNDMPARLEFHIYSF